MSSDEQSNFNHTSQCLNNLLAATRAISKIETPLCSDGDVFFKQIDNLAYLGFARANYYTDEQSRMVFDWLQQYRAIMSFHGSPIPLCLENPPFSNDEWERLERQAAAMTPYIMDDYPLDRIDVWILEAYSLKDECEALPGDIVLDCGAYTGNTSLYFSQKVGASGHVYGFEAARSTFGKYGRNMRGVENITPIHAAVGNTTGTLRFFGDDAGAYIAENGENGEEVPAITLDEFYRSRNLNKVDFIKMDVEGAEHIALEGAANIIRQHRPKMAISAYHRAFDIISLPARILSIAPYTFKLRHFSNREWETVLYCIPNNAETAVSPHMPESSIESGQYKELLFQILPLMRKILHDHNAQMQDTQKILQTATQAIKQIMEENTRLKEFIEKP